MQVLGKLAPPAGPTFTVPSVGQKIFGRFLASISAQVWRNITKNTKSTDFKKTGPLAGPFPVPPVPPGDQKFFWEVSGIYLSSSLKKYHQKYQEYRF